MIETEALTLPGGYVLPLCLETVTLREYVLEPAALAPEAAEALLAGESRRLTAAQLVAGTVETGTASVRLTEDSCRCRGVWNCLEQIAVTQPFELFREGEAHGEIDQRRAD